MNLFVVCLMLAIASNTVEGGNLSDDLFLFLPLLQKSDAIPSCGANELYRFCSGSCSDCDKRGHCAVTKCIGKCDCIPRYFRLTPEGPCEPVANCPKPECGENEVFRACGPLCERCNTYHCQIINCDYKCYCKQGYKRNRQNICIPEEECQKKKRCSRNEEWAESGPVDEYCSYGKNVTEIEEIQGIPQCYCKEGHKRNSFGRCINGTLCAEIQCPGIEVFHDCVPKCNTTCRNYGDSDCTEDDNCYPGCFCPSGYVMNDFRFCTTIEECSMDTSIVLEEDDDDSNTTSTTIPSMENCSINSTNSSEDTYVTESLLLNTNLTKTEEFEIDSSSEVFTIHENVTKSDNSSDFCDSGFITYENSTESQDSIDPDDSGSGSVDSEDLDFMKYENVTDFEYLIISDSSEGYENCTEIQDSIESDDISVTYVSSLKYGETFSDDIEDGLTTVSSYSNREKSVDELNENSDIVSDNDSDVEKENI